MKFAHSSIRALRLSGSSTVHKFRGIYQFCEVLTSQKLTGISWKLGRLLQWRCLNFLFHQTFQKQYVHEYPRYTSIWKKRADQSNLPWISPPVNICLTSSSCLRHLPCKGLRSGTAENMDNIKPSFAPRICQLLDWHWQTTDTSRDQIGVR